MTRGYSFPYYGPYYRGYGAPPFYQRFDTQTGVRLLFIAITIFLIGHIINFISFAMLNLSTPSLSNLTFITAIILTSVVGFCRLIAVIIGGISIYLFHMGRYDFNARHTKSIKWAEMFLLGYIIVIGISFAVTFSLLVSGIGSAYYIYYTITETLAIILSFFLGFMILFLVKEFVNPRIKDLLYIFAGLMVLIPIFQVIVWIFLPISLTTDFYWLDEPVLIAMTFFTLLHSIMWGLAAFVFYNINKGLKIHGRTIPKEPPSFLPRPEPVAKYAGEFYLRPKRAIFGVVVVTIILGVALGASYYVPNESDSSSSRFPEDMYDESPHSYGYTEFGEIFERETKQLELDLFCEVFSFRVDFYWTDEPDAPMRDNEPDRFTLEVNLGALSDSDSQENSQGDMGHIYIEWEFDVEDPRFIDYAEIVITLDDAGDQTGPGGIAQSPLTIEDNSNEFQLDVSYFYQAEL